eukprot:967272-Amphidinium_carterae.1
MLLVLVAAAVAGPVRPHKQLGEWFQSADGPVDSRPSLGYLSPQAFLALRLSLLFVAAAAVAVVARQHKQPGL